VGRVVVEEEHVVLEHVVLEHVQVIKFDDEMFNCCFKSINDIPEDLAFY
jgi:hypothetical protein